MYSLLFKLAKDHAPRILMIGAAFALLAGLYAYWSHSICKECKAEVTKVWMEREAKISKQAEKLIALRDAENKTTLEKQRNELLETITEYAKENDARERRLTASANKRLFVSAKCTSSSAARPGSVAEIPAGDARRGPETDKAELGEADTRTVYRTAIDAGKMAQICEAALDVIESNKLVE